MIALFPFLFILTLLSDYIQRVSPLISQIVSFPILIFIPLCWILLLKRSRLSIRSLPAIVGPSFLLALISISLYTIYTISSPTQFKLPYILLSLLCYLNLLVSLLFFSLRSNYCSPLLGRRFFFWMSFFGMLLLLVVSLSVLSNIFLGTSLGLVPVCSEHISRSYHDQEINLVCGIFDSSKKLSRYALLLVMYLRLTIGELFILSKPSSGLALRILFSFSILVSFLIFLISGSREGVVAALIVLPLLFFGFGRQNDVVVVHFFKFKAAFSSLRLPKSVLVLMTAVFVLCSMAVYIYLTEPSNLFLQYIFAVGDDSIPDRIASLLPFHLFLDSNSFFGHGLGSYGQEARYLGDRYNAALLSSLSLPTDYVYRILDSFFLKITLDFGLLGLISYSLLFASLSFFLLRRISSKSILFFVFVFFLFKLHLVMADPFFCLYFSFLSCAPPLVGPRLIQTFSSPSPCFSSASPYRI